LSEIVKVKIKEYYKYFPYKDTIYVCSYIKITGSRDNDYYFAIENVPAGQRELPLPGLIRAGTT
jgi:hypothetical protein